MNERELICIGCPMGCPIVVKMEDGKVVSVTGNTCPRGDAYARKEVTDPTRIVTTTVRVADGKVPMINVKTEHDIPKDKIFDRAIQSQYVPLLPKSGVSVILNSTGQPEPGTRYSVFTRNGRAA